MSVTPEGATAVVWCEKLATERLARRGLRGGRSEESKVAVRSERKEDISARGATNSMALAGWDLPTSPEGNSTRIFRQSRRITRSDWSHCRETLDRLAVASGWSPATLQTLRRGRGSSSAGVRFPAARLVVFVTQHFKHSRRWQAHRRKRFTQSDTRRRVFPSALPADVPAHDCTCFGWIYKYKRC